MSEDLGEMLRFACARGDSFGAEALILRGARVDAANGSRGQTPLYLAAFNGHAETCKLLLRNGADVHRTCMKAMTTSLHGAVEGGHAECARLLLQAKARVDEECADGKTPLEICVVQVEKAKGERAVDCAQVLVDAGAKIRVKERPLWLVALVERHRSCKIACLTLYGTLRKRRTGESRIPRDMLNLLLLFLWKTRANSKWRPQQEHDRPQQQERQARTHEDDLSKCSIQ